MSNKKTVLQTVSLTNSVQSEIYGSPSPGVVNCHNLHSSINDLIAEGIDLCWEEALLDIENEIRGILKELDLDVDSQEYQEKFDDLYEEKAEALAVHYDGGYSARLVGDWKKNRDGKYEIDHNGKEGWAGTYSNENGSTLVVEWSKWVAKCNQTSPCYIRKDTGGRCGDLDTPGDMWAYSVPPEFF